LSVASLSTFNIASVVAVTSVFSFCSSSFYTVVVAFASATVVVASTLDLTLASFAIFLFFSAT
jgi:hypothetical protein